MNNLGVVYPAQFFSISNVKIPIIVSKNKYKNTTLVLFDSIFKPTSTTEHLIPVNNNWHDVIKSVVDNITFFIKAENHSLTYELILQLLDPQYWKDNFFGALEEEITNLRPHGLSFGIKKSELVHTTQPLKTDVCFQDVSYVYKANDELESFTWDYITQNDDRQSETWKELGDVSSPTSKREIVSLGERPKSSGSHLEYYALTNILEEKDEFRDEPLPNQPSKGNAFNNPIPSQFVIHEISHPSNTDRPNTKNDGQFIDTYNQVLQDFESLSLSQTCNPSGEEKINPIQNSIENDNIKRIGNDESTHPKPISTHLIVDPLRKQNIKTDTQEPESDLTQLEENEFTYDEIQVDDLHVTSVKTFNLKYFVNNVFHAREIFSDMHKLLDGDI